MKQDRFQEWLSGVDELTASQRSEAESVVSGRSNRLSGPASAVAAQEGGLLAVFAGCVGGLVGRLEAIGSEFPEFQSGEVRLESFVARAVHADPAAFLEPRPSDKALYDARKACTAADRVAAVLGALRDGQPKKAGKLWDRWYGRPSGWQND